MNKQYYMHDKMYKKLFSDSIIFERLLTSFVNEDFIKDLDFSTLKNINSTFITSRLNKYESDIIYQVNYKNRPVYIFLLLEFQSTADKKMPLRFLRYILELYEKMGPVNKKGVFPAIFPILLYNGDRKWSAKLNISDIIQQTIPKQFIPNLQYFPILINQIPRETLLNIHNSVAAIFYMENTKTSECIKAIEELVGFLKESTIIEKKLVVNWLINFFRKQDIYLNEEDYDKIEDIEETFVMIKEEIKSFKGYWLNEGRDEGRVEGREEEKIEVAKKLLENGSELSFVEKITNLPIDVLKKISKDIK